MLGKYSFDVLSSISRKLSFLPRGKVGGFLNYLTNQVNQDPIKSFVANNGLIYISDLRSYTENYVPWTGEYEGKIIDSLLNIVPKNMNVVDIGGNVGYWTINLANHIDEGSKVFVFEPVLNNFQRIKEMVKLNNLNKQTKLLNYGLGDKLENVDFEIGDYDKRNKATTFNATLKQNKKGGVKVVSLDSIYKKIKLNSVGFIKIDIEGYEVKFLKGAVNFFKDNRPIVYGEFTKSTILKNGDDFGYIFRFFKDYTFYKEGKKGTFSHLDKKDFERDILIVPNEKINYVRSLIEIP